ncbi:hypothetical protein BU23DRAFT_331540 [Bimuria novae-zelandiae CBS 107.79]|uniref:Sister chromatid cohesion protein-like protein Dcc1 n=1 Tax=Bimuria novae-zelandiae CBS 107.79 TaxID=1447943 RepID=A0A6A5UQV4_9PLEO|nr:hypothetical protein BU23DRAFT_331540 [Bimuria novae-zelandiae CBS 107.79]
MATQQKDGGVPFAVTHELQSFRLLELPPEIVELLEAPNPPQLSIKSLPPAASGAANPKPAYAVLCTPNKSFQIRQVQTSNSVFVTQPSYEAHGNEIPTPATCAIASCSTTLELYPADASAVAHLGDVLPVYDIVGGEVDTTENGRSKGDVLADIPLSNAQCEQGWNEIIAFELSRSSYRPSVNILRQVWSSINAAALAENIKLDSQFLGYDLAELVAEESYPAPLTMAILRHLAKSEQDTKGQWSCLDRRRTVSFVGRILLQARQTSSEYRVADFIEEWKDSLPEAWRSEAQLKVIEGTYELPSSTTIRAKSIPAATTETATAKPTAAKGKWHERFAKTRKK